MASKQTQEILDQLAGIRRRIDELSDHWEVNHDVAIVIRGLDELSAALAWADGCGDPAVSGSSVRLLAGVVARHSLRPE